MTMHLSPGPMPLRVLVTGSDGYIGAVLCPMLMAAGHEVTGLDTGFYRRGWLFDDRQPRPRTLTRDIREVTADDLTPFDAVIHLSELSNDPLGENDPDLTMAINHRGSVALARAARDAGVARFVYASSCSIYGAGGDDWRTEDSPTAPQTAYARCKILVETDLAALRDDGFAPVFLRNATAYGASPRQRFDIVMNNLCGLAHTTGRIAMTSDGSPWRPIVHVEDICRAMIAALEADPDAVAGEAFNVGRDDGNHRIREIAETVGRVFAGAEVTTGPDAGDTRSYRVSFAKIRDRIPAFRPAWDAERGAVQLRDLFARIGLTAEMFAADPYTRLRELRHLQQTGQIDARLFWTPLAA
jgi:nucleoside-diphosphate-sugar epimerase